MASKAHKRKKSDNSNLYKAMNFHNAEFFYTKRNFNNYKKKVCDSNRK